MEEKGFEKDIKTKLMLSKYNDFMQEFKSCSTQEDFFKVFNSRPTFFKEFFDLFREQVCSNNFDLNYQPQISNGKCKSAEALFRCKIEGTFLNPAAMFALASYYNFEKELNILILNKICKDITTFRSKISPDFNVSFNINPQLIDRDFYNLFYSTLAKNNLSPQSIGIELLESSPFDKVNSNLIKNFINNGTSIYLDDYGTGFANIETLKSTPFTHVKFAGEIVSGIDANPQNQNIIISALEHCNSNGIKTVFEHVETKEELLTINKLSNNTSTIQGYYFSKPLDSASLVEYTNQLNLQEENLKEN